MARNVPLRIHVEGVKEIRKRLKELEGALGPELREINVGAAKIVAEEARKRAPVDTGALKGNVRATGGAASSAVSVGDRRKIRYAGPLMYGHKPRAQGGYMWPPRPFLLDAAQAKRDEVRDFYEKAIAQLVKDKGL